MEHAGVVVVATEHAGVVVVATDVCSVPGLWVQFLRVSLE